MNFDPDASDTQHRIDKIYDKIHEKMSHLREDLQERQNRGAMLISIIEPMEGQKCPEAGDTMKVNSPSGKEHEAEIIDAHRVMAYHPTYGPVPAFEILAEVVDPDRMTKDDFESLYGEGEKNDDQGSTGCSEGAEQVPDTSEVRGEETAPEDEGRTPDEGLCSLPDAIRRCECGADLSDCRMNQEYFGVHVNPYGGE